MNERTKQQALKVLDGIEQITKREMLVFGSYVSEEIENPELAEQGAICGGHTACLVGSAYLAGGIKTYKVRQRGGVSLYQLPSVEQGGLRIRYLRHRHGLRAALEALDVAADRRIKNFGDSTAEYDIRSGVEGGGPGALAEDLFENYNSPWHSPESRPGDVGYIDTKKRVLSLVRSARKIVEADS